MGLINRIYKSIRYRIPRLLLQANQLGQRALHRGRLPKLGLLETKIVEGLKKDGAYISSIEELNGLGIPGSWENCKMLKSAFKSFESEINNNNGYTFHVPKTTIFENSEVLKWGLNEKLLAIVERYIGLPPLFAGITLRRDAADSKQEKTRLWHIDNEDTRIIKIIIYLEDVGPNDGPFCYIPLTAANNYKLKNIGDNRLSDLDMNKINPENDQIECTGPAGTVVFADTCSVWHRGKTGTDNNRYAAFYLYSSRIPLRPETMKRKFPVSDFILRHPDLSSAQKETI